MKLEDYLIRLTALFQAVQSLGNSKKMQEKKRFIIDSDGAADDIRAISLALQSPNIKVVAITAVHGVVNVDQVVCNLSRTLRANKAKVPIYKGAFEPLVAMTGKELDESFFFGKDGMGDRPDKYPKVIPEDRENYDKNLTAALALIKLLKENDDITLVCLGPLTNIALALKLDKDFASRVKEVYIMGGNIYGVGNMKSEFTSEFNFGGDPEAAYIVLSKMTCPITVIPWEAFFFESDKHQDEVDFDAHLRLGTPLADYLATVTQVGRDILAKNGRQFSYCDEVAMATAIDAETVIKESRLLRASVELGGYHTRGQVACDWTDKLFSEMELAHKLDRGRRPIRFVLSYNVKVVDGMINEMVRNAA